MDPAVPTPFRLTEPRSHALHILGVVLAAIVFAVDLKVPMGSAIGMLYVGVILLGLWSPWRPYPLVAAAGASVLALVDVAVGWSGEIPAAVFVNRPLMIAVFVITGVVVGAAVAKAVGVVADRAEGDS